MVKRVFVLIVAACLLLSLAGCQKEEPVRSGENLMEGIRRENTDTADLQADCPAVTDFSVRLFQANVRSGENVLVSPLSVLYALSMTANGADGDTLDQMETVMGLPSETLNVWMHTYLHQFSENDGLYLANAIWFKDDPALTPQADFLQTNANYYGADIYKAPFNPATCEDINRWIEDNTNGMIPEALDEIHDDAVMYLLNALAFDAKWEEKYKEKQLRDWTFTTESGEEQLVQMMLSEESWYLEDAYATGFMKPYKGGKFAFVALLPNADTTVEEYIDNLSAQQLKQMLSQPQEITVNAGIPEFEVTYDAPMGEALCEMGMTNAFDRIDADFSRMATHDTWNICIRRLLHKTCISVTAQGTKAAAETTVEMDAPSAPPPGLEEYVILDRPFLYMIMDCENQIPIFMCVMMEIE